ncbi:hypothetical protein B0I35DRAFT_364577 [Stachybotrys elegans]|uniref:Uncharacterized protein n=1 Tax=Stachybotrys elegans TaxID=80388 RepID=A0A8K0WJN9_9HYPO|nr:hypothetical protein B0I35DRAFT_364577 [Stachybotrys elegans]
MRFHFFFLLAWMATGVLGSGLRSAYEKIMLFYAYRLELLLPEDQRTIGYRCATQLQPTDDVYMPCPEPPNGQPKYLPCHMVNGPAKECNLVQFLVHIDGKGQGALKKRVFDGNQDRLNFDIDAAARKIEQFTWDRPLALPRHVFKGGCLPQHMVDGKTPYEGMVKSVFERVAYAKSHIPPTETSKAEVKDLFDRVETSRAAVHRARTADHDYFVKRSLEQAIPGIDVKVHNEGYQVHYKEKSREVFLISYDETKLANVASIPDIEDKISQALANRLVHKQGETTAEAAEVEAAKVHQITMEAWAQGKSTMDNAILSCNAPSS